MQPTEVALNRTSEYPTRSYIWVTFTLSQDIGSDKSAL